jgi:hypothetical protein
MFYTRKAAKVELHKNSLTFRSIAVRFRPLYLPSFTACMEQKLKPTVNMLMLYGGPVWSSRPSQGGNMRNLDFRD